MPTGGNRSRSLQSGAGGDGPSVTRLCALGVCGPLVGAGASWDVGLSVAGVWGLRGMGVTRHALWLCLWRACAGFWVGSWMHVTGLPAMHAGRVWAIRSGLGREGQGFVAGFACGVSVPVLARGGVHVWSAVGVEVWRWSLLSTAAAGRILQMLLRTWCISWSVVGREYFRGGLRSTLRWILWTVW